jgi:LysR family glycine cleavage system transcriptional activator
MKRLPPVFALRALETAARHRSYSRAAEELGVTHSAVSQQIRRLEAELGARLFDRRGNAMIPTSEADRLAAALRRGFDLLTDAVAEFRDSAGRDPLVVTLCSQFASRWLHARLPRLLSSPAGANVELRVDDGLMNMTTDGVDMGIRYGSGDWPGLVSESLLAETLTPVCSPEVAARWQLRRPADLLSAPLLHGVHRPWCLWFDAIGLASPPVGPLLYEDSLDLLRAATQGLGVALARSSVVEPDLNAGRLVKLLPLEVPSDLGYFLVWRADNRKLARIHALRDWLKAQAKPSVLTHRAAA